MVTRGQASSSTHLCILHEPSSRIRGDNHFFWSLPRCQTSVRDAVGFGMEVWMKEKQMGVVHLDAMWFCGTALCLQSPTPVLPYSARTSFYCTRSCVGRIFNGFLKIMVESKSRPRTWFICPNNGGRVQYVRCQCSQHDLSFALPRKPQRRQWTIQSNVHALCK